MTSEATLVDASMFPCLIVRVGGQVVQEIELRADLNIGRAEDNELQLPDPKASRHHARLHQEGAVFVLTDLGSANGTWVNGIRLADPHPLEHGDRITIGDTELTYQEPGRAVQDTLTMPGVGATVEAARQVPPPPPLEAPTEPVTGMSRGLTIALVAVAAVVLVAIVVILLNLTGAIGPAAPTPTLVAGGLTSVASAGTPATTAEATVVTATPDTTAADAEEFNDLLVQAEALTRRSKFEEAIAIYEELTAWAPDDARPEIGWAWALILDDEAAEALPHAQQAVELDPTSAPAAAVLGRTYVELGDEAEALTWGQKAVELEPGSAQAHAVLAEAYLVNGQTQQAVDEADLALVQDINNANAHRIRGWLYLLVNNDMGRAAGELQIAAGLQPELWLRRHELGALLQEAEDYGTAIIAFQDALGIRPKAVTYTAIGEVNYRLGQYDQAKASLQQAFAAGAEDAQTYALLAATYAQLDQCDRAETYSEQALEMEPDQPLAVEAEELCQGTRPSATPSPTLVSAVTPTLTSPPGATPQPTQTSPPPPAISGRIAFPVWNGDEGKYDVYVANVDGSGRRLVAGEMHQPALSPDGAWVVMNGERPSYQNLVLAESDGSEQREITEFIEDGQANWSPNGRQLVFASTRHGDKQFRIYVMDDVPFGGGKVEGRSLNYGPDDVRGQMPAWTSNNRIVYRGCDLSSAATECNGLGLYLISVAPGPQTPTELTDDPEDTAPTVYGETVAFMSNRDGTWEIYTIALDGSGLKRLTSNASNDGLPIWSPDGKTIAYVSDQGGAWAVWAMNPDGSNQRRLFAIGGGGLTFDWQHERISWGQ